MRKYWFVIPALALLLGCKRGSMDVGRQDTEVAGTVETETFYDTEAASSHALEIPAPMRGVKEQIIRRKGYTVSYNRDTKIANWVAWHLTAQRTRGNASRDNMEFTEDTSVPTPRADDWDYYNSTYDRGHLCPAGDNKWDRKAMTESFLLTNICPQNHNLNKYEWNDIEIQCREWARQYGDVYIVTGPVFRNGVSKTIGKHKVAVPDAFFKVVLCNGNKAKAVGFLCENRGGKKKIADCLRSVDDIERMTGIDFFPALDDKTENMVEGMSKDAMSNGWQIWRIEDMKKHRNSYNR
ncbi:MAG: DNA/RNA non-specific endonuclease [Prevotella sp.]|nr:DNA/RNA non-specific endonuclease [Prevotella sp.]